MEQTSPYIMGILKIEEYFIAHDVTVKTPKHAHTIELPDEVLHSKISVPGYKYGAPNLYKDFVVEFKHNDQYHKISYSDLAVDIYQKIRFNPDNLKAMGKFIIDIGIHGEETPIPDELVTIKIHSPILVLIGHIKKYMSGHRLNSLSFGIPVSYYPKILYWLGMNEEINYAPKNSEHWGGRRTAFKRLIEVVYVAAIALKRNDDKLTPEDKRNLIIVLERIKRGKNDDFDDFPDSYKRAFAIIDAYEHAN